MVLRQTKVFKPTYVTVNVLTGREESHYH